MAAEETSASETSGVEATSKNDDLFVAFVGPNHEVYSRALEKMPAKDPTLRKIPMTWCWPAFIITIPWLLYRKLYGWAAGLIGAVIVISLVLPESSSKGMFGTYVVLGMLAKSFYVQHALKRIEKLRSRASSEDGLEALVRKAGGVSIPGAVIGTILFVGFNVLAFMSIYVERG